MTKKIILTGISGRLGRRMMRRLARDYHVIGIDSRPCPDLPPNVVHHQVDVRRRPAEDVFRKSDAVAVVHLGVVHNFRIPAEALYARNVMGTETLLRYVSQYQIPKLVMLSSADVYGPHPGNSHFLDEEAPLLASQRFPEIRTLIAVDRSVQSFFWRYPAIETVILRPAHIVGPNVRNAPSNYLRLRMIPTLLGFDPMVQLINEDDCIQAVWASLQEGVRGVFNVASTSPVPLLRLLKYLQKPICPIPHPLFQFALKQAWRYGLTSFPPPELDHIRFSCVLDTTRAEQQLGIRPQSHLYDLLEPFRSYRHDLDYKAAY